MPVNSGFITYRSENLNAIMHHWYLVKALNLPLNLTVVERYLAPKRTAHWSNQTNRDKALSPAGRPRSNDRSTLKPAYQLSNTILHNPTHQPNTTPTNNRNNSHPHQQPNKAASIHSTNQTNPTHTFTTLIPRCIQPITTHKHRTEHLATQHLSLSDTANMHAHAL